jgi:hypothetical protein
MVTGAAAGLLVTLGHQAGDLRLAGAAGGALLAVAGVVLGVLPPGPRPGAGPVSATMPGWRFFRDRRGAPRHASGSQVRVSVDGHAYQATLLNVSSSGALLRLPPHVARRLRTEVGAPVRIENHPIGALARVGAHGLYVDFAVAFAPAAAAADFDAVQPH